MCVWLKCGKGSLWVSFFKDKTSGCRRALGAFSSCSGLEGKTSEAIKYQNSKCVKFVWSERILFHHMSLLCGGHSGNVSVTV